MNLASGAESEVIKMRELKKGDILAIKNMICKYQILEIESFKNEYDYSISILHVENLENSLEYRFSIPTEKIPVFITKLEG